MGLPQPAEARLFYRAAKQRYDEAELLLGAGRTTGAVYLAGYTVECMLKALLLASASRRGRRQMLAEFRGNRAHSIEWLGMQYRRLVGTALPHGVTRKIARLAFWSTDLRYSAVAVKKQSAQEFMESVLVVAEWADGRM